MLPARQVYIFENSTLEGKFSSDMKRDRTKLRRAPFQRVNNADFKDQDYARCKELYALLYLGKYTPLNPQYTAAYIREMHRRHLIQLEGLRDQFGVLVAVTGLFVNGNTLTQPIVGYDTSRPLKEGLYRMVMAMAQDHAIENELYFNMSAGAAEFKRLRGAVAAIEFTAIYEKHLPKTQRTASAVVEQVLSRVGIPLLQRFEL